MLTKYYELSYKNKRVNNTYVRYFYIININIDLEF